MTRARVAWGIAGVDVVAFIGAMIVNPSDLSVVLYAVGIASFAGVGALLVDRVPQNPIGPLLLAAGTVLVAAIVIGSYADVGAAQQPPWPGAGFARDLGDLLFFYPFVIAFIGVPLIFPDGRLLSPRFRWVVAIAMANTTAWTLGGLSIANLDGFVLVGTLFSFGAAIFAIALRYRRGDPTQRQQIKWLAADVGLAIAALIPALLLAGSYPTLADVFSSVAIIAMLAMPVVIGIAVMRYRLYEITGSSAGPSRTRSSRSSWPWCSAGLWSCSRPSCRRSPRARPSPWQPRRWRCSPSSSLSCVACGAPWIAASTEPGMTLRRRPRHSRAGCATRWTSTRSPATSIGQCVAPLGHPRSVCGFE